MNPAKVSQLSNAPTAMPALRVGHVEGRRRRREASTRRMLGRVVVPISDARSVEAAANLSKRTRGRSILSFSGFVALAFFIHAAGLGVALLASRFNIVQENLAEKVTIEVREVEAPPAVDPELPLVRDPEIPAVETPAAPVVAKAEPKVPLKKEPPPDPTSSVPDEVPPVPASAEPPRSAPLRVVGLSLDSTSATGEGPSFAVGNTRMGSTAERAADPSKVQAIESTRSSPNRVASRIPVSGVTFTPPARKSTLPPPYPELLRQQGIEADVVVLASIDVQGRVLRVDIVKGSTYPEFNEAAKTAALGESFIPAMRNGEPIPYSLKYTYFFRLTES